MLVVYYIFVVAVLLDQVVSDDPTTCTKYGLELDHPGTSCADIYEKNPASHYKSGLHVIKTNKVQLVYCDMSLECGSHKGGWMRIADLNSSRDNCPPGWIKNSGYNSLCTGGSAAGCYSAHFTTDGTSFSRICGMMKGYQKGSMDAFHPYSSASGKGYPSPVTVSTTLDGIYVDGVSITYGNPHKHIWTYAVGLSEDHNYGILNCPCAKYPGATPPPYIGNDYYCESGNSGRYEGEESTLYPGDPLWDGNNCPSENNCCNRPGMPWFFQQLPVKESASSIEVRICNDQVFGNEGVVIETLQLYIQ
ncbi:uncharacterized protein [Dysidea avara]|uniref:uncharacterized protein n=1 Tax=Dysidea avara TaxID=196820 RepID=UPI00331793A4